VPLAHPDPPLRVRPHPPRALALGGRLDDGGGARVEIDAGDVAPREGGVVDGAVRRGGDAVGPAATRSVPDVHLACPGVQPAVDAVLAREPDPAALVVTLGRVPDDAVLADGDVVRMATSRGQGIRLRGDLRLRARGASQKERQDEEDEMHTETAHIVLLGSGQTVTGLYTGVRHSGNRWSIPRTTFM